MPVARKSSNTKLDRMLTPVTHDDLHEWTRRLDFAVDKFADATANLSITMAKHAQRLDYGDKTIEALQSDNKRLETKMDLNQKDMHSRLDAQTTAVKAHFDETVKPLATKVSVLNQWRWMITGVIGFLIAVGGIIAWVHELVKP